MRNYLNLSITALTLFFIPALVHAQKAKVLKIQGNKAIVEFQNFKPETGKSYSISEDTQVKKTTTSQRKNSVSISGSLVQATRKTGSSSISGMQLNATSRYGINQVTYEYGPIINLNIDNAAANKVTDYSLGAFFEKNVIPNNSQASKVYGYGGELSFGRITVNGNTVSSFTVFPYGFYKIYALAPNIAFDVKAGYEMVKFNSTPKMEENNIKIAFGLSVYY
ncbi:MAG: hypothetical protein ACK41T_10765 [Pseudobdellovibrio sp.]